MPEKITVVGPGTMGIGITQTFLQAGFDVILIGRSDDSLKKGVERLEEAMDKTIMKGRLTQDEKAKLLRRLKVSEEYDDANGSVLIIEAVPEIPEEKANVYKMAGEHAGGSILATNTSSIPINELARSVKNPEAFLGLHFFNPVPVMKPVEVVVGSATSRETVERAIGLVQRCGKTAIQVNDYPGFVANCVLMPMLNEAILLLDKKVSTKEGIDTIVKLGLNHPMGPLELSDFIGLDVCRDIMESIYKETGDEKFKPARLLEELVSKGKLGRKSGEGFYKYR